MGYCISVMDVLNLSLIIIIDEKPFWAVTLETASLLVYILPLINFSLYVFC